MTKNQKKALRFAYELLCGRYKTNRPLYTYPSIPADARHEPDPSDYHWIEPDRDPDRPYLNEAVFSELVIRGYFEVMTLLPTQKWVYRLSPEGCAALGKAWPLHSDTLKALGRRAANRISRLRKYNDPHKFTKKQTTIDPHKFRRSPDWRRC